MALNKEFYFHSTEYKKAMGLISQNIYGTTDTAKIGKKEREWLWGEVAKNAADADVEKDNNGKVIRFKYSSQYYLKEVLEVKIKRFLQEAKKAKDGSAQAKILEQLAVQHAMRLFLLTVPKKKTQEDNKNNNNTDTTNNSEYSQGSTKGKQKYYEFFKPSDVSDVKGVYDSALASYKEFEEWLKKQDFYTNNPISASSLHAYFNGYTNYIQKAAKVAKGVYSLSTFPKDLSKTIANYLDDESSNSFFSVDRHHHEYFAKLRNLFEVHCKSKTKKECLTILANRFDVYRNLVSLDLRDITLDNAQFTDALRDIEKFSKLKDLQLSIANSQQLTELARKNSLKDQISALNLGKVTLDNAQFANALDALRDIKTFRKLKKLRLKVANQAQLIQLIRVLRQSGNTPDFWNDAQLEISGIEQDWINLENTKKLLKKYSNLSLWFKELGSLDYGDGDGKTITIPERLHVLGELSLGHKEINFAAGMHVGEDLSITGNKSLRKVNFATGTHVKETLWLIENPYLKKANFATGMQVGNTLWIAGNKSLRKVNFAAGMQVKGNVFLERNPKLKKVKFADGVKIWNLCMLEIPRLTKIKVGKGVEIEKADLSGCKAGVLKAFFHNVRGMEKLKLGKDVKVAGSGLFVALLLNPALKRGNVKRPDTKLGFFAKSNFFGKKWFGLRDKLLEANQKGISGVNKLTAKELKLLREVQEDLQDYLDSHHPDTEKAGRLNDNNDKKDLNDNSGKHTQNKEITEAPAKDYNMIEQLIAGLEKLPDTELKNVSLEDNEIGCCIIT